MPATEVDMKEPGILFGVRKLACALTKAFGRNNLSNSVRGHQQELGTVPSEARHERRRDCPQFLRTWQINFDQRPKEARFPFAKTSFGIVFQPQIPGSELPHSKAYNFLKILRIRDPEGDR